VGSILFWKDSIYLFCLVWILISLCLLNIFVYRKDSCFLVILLFSFIYIYACFFRIFFVYHKLVNKHLYIIRYTSIYAVSPTWPTVMRWFGRLSRPTRWHWRRHVSSSCSSCSWESARYGGRCAGRLTSSPRRAIVPAARDSSSYGHSSTTACTRRPHTRRPHVTTVTETLTSSENPMANNNVILYFRFTRCSGVANKYVGPPFCRTEMYAGRVACCPLMSHGGVCRRDEPTDGRQTVTLRFPLDSANVIRRGSRSNCHSVGNRHWQSDQNVRPHL